MNPAAIAWIVVALEVILTVAGYDTWAHFTHHPTMTHYMDELLQNHAAAPFIVWFWTGAIPAWFYHLWQSRNSKI